MESLGQIDLESREKRVEIINQDSFYCDLNEEQKMLAASGEYNFDHPGIVRTRQLNENNVQCIPFVCCDRCV